MTARLEGPGGLLLEGRWRLLLRVSTTPVGRLLEGRWRLLLLVATTPVGLLLEGRWRLLPLGAKTPVGLCSDGPVGLCSGGPVGLAHCFIGPQSRIGRKRRVVAFAKKKNAQCRSFQ